MTEQTFELKVMTGVKMLDPIEYRVVSVTEGPSWWRQTRYYVESQFMRLGSFDTKREAESAAAALRD